MARSEARLLVSIWDDPDFLALSPMAQRLFLFLISQPDLTHDGVLAIRERRWSKKAAGLTQAEIIDSLDELAAARFVVVDEDAEELVIRSFIRRDRVYRQPNVLHAAADHLATVSSPIIRAAVAVELDRIKATDQEIPEKAAPILDAMIEALNKGSRNPSANPSGNPSVARPGERGGVREVVTDSPFPVASQISPPPGPRGAAPPRPREDAPKRGTRVPDDFAVTAEMVAWAREHTPDADGRVQTAAFIDYWRGKTGKDATKLDWPATWRNWMRKAQGDHDRQRRRGPGPAQGGVHRNVTDDRVDATLELGRQMQAEMDARNGRMEIPQ